MGYFLRMFIFIYCLSLGYAESPLGNEEPTYSYKATFPGLLRSLETQEQLDALVADMAKKYYKLLNERFTFCENGEPIRSNSPMWIVLKKEKARLNRSSYELYYYVDDKDKYLQLHPDASLSLALRDLLEKGGTINTSIAESLIRELITCELLGDDDYLSRLPYAPPYALPYKCPYVEPHEFAIRYYERTNYVRDGTPTQAGHFGYITNVKGYNKANSLAGQHTYCVGNDLYYGFGPLFTEGPRRQQNILDALYTATHVLPAKSNIADFIVKIFKENESSREQRRREILEKNKILWERVRRIEQKKEHVYSFSLRDLRDDRGRKKDEVLLGRAGGFLTYPLLPLKKDHNEIKRNFRAYASLFGLGDILG
ncbi:MAG: hypothetical protein KBD04_00645 [Proteobacteria bacterium]|nr:hypothetical protein [Pseudomonadota bacterium]